MFGIERLSPLTSQIEKLRETVTDLKAAIALLTKKRESLADEVGLSETIIALKKRVVELEIQEGKIKEGHAKEDRELRHMIGLEKKRQEFEVEAAKRDAVLAVREENLKAERDAFQKQMDFQNKRFTDEVGYLKGMVGQVLERLPSMMITKKA